MKLRLRKGKKIFLVALSLVVLLSVVTAPVLADKGNPPGVGSPTAYTEISGNPLTIDVAVDLSLQVFYAGQSDGQVYPAGPPEADSGFMAWIGGNVYGPDWSGHPLSAAMDVTDWTPVSQTAVTGSGTAADPWLVTTVVDAGATGLRISETLSYVNGQDYFRQDWQVCNNSGSSVSATFFHAADLYLQGSDEGYGYYDAATGAVGGYNQTQDWYEIFVPITAASAYEEDYYGTIWSHIGGPTSPGPGFDSSINPNFIDNGAGLQWSDVAIAAGACTTISDWWSFGTTPQIPPTPTPGTPTPTVPAPTPTVPAPTPTPTPTPEPFIPEANTMILLGSGLAGLAGYASLRLRARRNRDD